MMTDQNSNDLVNSKGDANMLQDISSRTSMRNITRMDYARKDNKGRTQGWWVRMKRGSETFSRMFSDGKYGGKDKALAAAMRYRDELEKKYGVADYTGFRTDKTARNKSGVIGVHKDTKRKTKANGRIYSYEFWIASWVDEKGKHHVRSFSISKYGEAEALRLALKERDRAVALLHNKKKQRSDWENIPLEGLVTLVESVESSYEKGFALEELAARLFRSVAGFSITDRQVRTNTEEIDIEILNDCQFAPFRDEYALILVECKNWSEKCGKNEFVLFKEKIDNRSGRSSLGFFVSWNGFADTFTREMLRGSHDRTLVVPLDGERIRAAVEGEDFCQILVDAWHKAVRL